MNYNLKNLCEKYNCDKLEHAYIEIYQKYFVNLKNQELNLLEIGVSDGASIKVWSDYFVNSNVVGIDIKNIDIEKKGLNRKNISIYQGSQSDKSFINKIIGIHRNFDIIIDDGSHKLSDIIISLNTFFRNLTPGGFYVLEDFKFPNYYPHLYDCSENKIDEILNCLKNKKFYEFSCCF